MRRYKIVTYKLENVKRNIKSKQDAEALTEALIREFNIEKSFFCKLDVGYTVLNYILTVLQILYIPIYFLGVLLLMFARILLAIAYLLLFQFKQSTDIFKFMLIWRQ